MNKYHTLCLLGFVAVLVGCGQGAVVVQEVSPVVQEPVEALGAVSDSVSPESIPESVLVITERFVDWGFTLARRTGSEIDTVIVHSVYNPFVEKEQYDLGEILEIFRGYGVVPHYIITRDGQVHYTVAEKDIAYHAGRSRVPDGRTSVNDFSIGIEMINSIEDVYTPEQYDALRMLIEDINQRHGLTYVLGHDEIAVEDPWNFDWEQINDLRHEVRTVE